MVTRARLPGWHGRRYLLVALPMFVLLMVVVVVVAYWVLGHYAQIATGFFAKYLCSGVFVADRLPEQVREHDILVYSPKPLFAAIS